MKNPRPILGKRAVRGLHRLLDAVPAHVCLNDPDMTAAVRYLSTYLAWHADPAITAKRQARGQSIKQWAARNRLPAVQN